MIRVYYKFKRPEGGYYDVEHSMPVADMAQFEARRRLPEYGLAGAKVVRVEEIVYPAPPTKGEEEYYARWGTAGEF